MITDNTHFSSVQIPNELIKPYITGRELLRLGYSHACVFIPANLTFFVNAKSKIEATRMLFRISGISILKW